MEQTDRFQRGLASNERRPPDVTGKFVLVQELEKLVREGLEHGKEEAQP